MSEDYEYDPFEYAEALADGEGLGGSDLDETRRRRRTTTVAA